MSSSRASHRLEMAPEDDIRVMGDSGDKTRRKVILIGVGIVIGVIATLVLLGFILSRGTKPEPVPGTNLWENIRLPKNIVPQHYALEVTTDMERFTFSGQVTITLQITDYAPEYQHQQNTILVHMHPESLNTTGYARPGQDSASVQPISLFSVANQTTIHPQEYFIYEQNEFLVMRFPNPLTPGVYKLSIGFKSELSDRILSGYYRSSYRSGGLIQWIASTDFEPSDARRAFPCFDEPAMKANYTTTMIHTNDYHALANMPQVSSTPLAEGSRWMITTFAESVPMSTYLVCYIVSKFEYVETVTPEGVTVRVYTQPGKSEQGRFALEAGSKILSFYANFFGLAYPLPKQDMIAIPEFNSGAMENWGLITYRETALLVDPQQSSTSERQRVAAVVAHELAHQWFGNIVTMKWWNDLWLNEGFASYVEYLGVNAVYPEWRMMDQSIDDWSTAVYQDSLSTTHPIAVNVSSPGEVSQLFDAISYSKGCAILRMLVQHLSLPVFREGVQLYLRSFVYDNAETTDLWAALSEVSGSDIAFVMSPWTDVKGYPVVKLEYNTGSAATATALIASQTRFYLSPPINSTDNDSPVWYVPMGVRSETGGDAVHDIPRIQSGFSIPYSKAINGSWIKANINTAGTYRVHYPEDILESLRSSIFSLSETDRVGLIDDVFAFQNAGLLKPSQALRFIAGFLDREDSYLVWNSALTQLYQMNALIDTNENYGYFKSFVLSLVRPALARVPPLNETVAYTPEGHLTNLLRARLMYAAVFFGAEEIVSAANTIFETRPLEAIDPDVRDAVYVSAVANGDLRQWETVYNRYVSSDFAAERVRALRAMAMSRQPYLIAKSLAIAFSGTVKTSDAVSLVEYISSNPAGRTAAWTFVKENWNYILDTYGRVSFTLPRLITSVTGRFTSQAMYDEVKAFFAANPADSATTAIGQSLEKIQSNVAWSKSSLPDLAEFLRNYA